MMRERSSLRRVRCRVSSRSSRSCAEGTKLGREPPMLQEIGNPLGVFEVGLATSDGFDMLGIDHQQLEVAFQQIVNGFPEHASTLHSDMRHAQAFEPVAQGQPVSRHGVEGAPLFVELSVNIWRVSAGHDRPLVDVQTRAAFVHHMHVSPPKVTEYHREDGQRDAKPGSNSPLRASPCGERQTVVLAGIRDHTVGPAHSTSLKPISGVASILPSFYLFSCAVVRRRRMSHCWRMQGIVQLSLASRKSLQDAFLSGEPGKPIELVGLFVGYPTFHCLFHSPTESCKGGLRPPRLPDQVRPILTWKSSK